MTILLNGSQTLPLTFVEVPTSAVVKIRSPPTCHIRYNSFVYKRTKGRRIARVSFQGLQGNSQIHVSSIFRNSERRKIGCCEQSANMSPSMPILAILFNLCLLFGQHDSMTDALTISKTCFGCICEAASGCNVTIGCDESVCGPFSITWGYWVDAGKPKLDGTFSQNSDGFQQCVSDPYCAARTVQGYMEKFAQDCNGDGTINCDDFLRIHRLGGYGCSAPINAKYEDTYKRCMATYNV